MYVYISFANSEIGRQMYFSLFFSVDTTEKKNEY